MLIALIPAYNSEATIGKVIHKAKQYCDKVIVFNDGSTDMTPIFAEIFGARVIDGKTNMGKGFALKKLFWEVSDIKEDDIVVTIDADNQHNPEDIPKLVAPIKNGEVDYVVGVRKHIPWWRKGPNGVLDVLLGNKETQSGFRAYSGKAIWSIEISQTGFGVDAEILACLNGMKRGNVAIDVKYDMYSHTKFALIHFLEVFSYALTTNPLVYLCVPAIVIFGGSLYGFIRVVNIWQQIHQLAVGTMIISMTAMVLSVITFFTGIILRVLGKVNKGGIR